MTISIIPAVRPEHILFINRKLVCNRIELGHANEAVAFAAVLFTYQLERELAAGQIEADVAIRKANVLCRAACFTHPDWTGGVS